MRITKGRKGLGRSLFALVLSRVSHCDLRDL